MARFSPTLRTAAAAACGAHGCWDLSVDGRALARHLGEPAPRDPRTYLRELCDYWVDGYDWRATEARLNRLPQFRTDIDGLGIHFVHVRSRHPEALPLVLTPAP